MAKNDSKIKLGDKSLLNSDYENPSEQKLRITTWIDGDIYDELQKRAKAGEGKGRYQTLMNEVLREALLSANTKDPFAVPQSQSKDRDSLNEIKNLFQTLLLALRSDIQKVPRSLKEEIDGSLEKYIRGKLEKAPGIASKLAKSNSKTTKRRA